MRKCIFPRKKGEVKEEEGKVKRLCEGIGQEDKINGGKREDDDERKKT